MMLTFGEIVVIIHCTEIGDRKCCWRIPSTVFTLLIVPGVYFKHGIVDPTFI